MAAFDDHGRARISRAPVVITIGGLALAFGLVILGAKLAAVPAASPDLSHPGTRASPRPVAVIMRDYVFNPSPLYLVAGETVEFEIFNAGVVAHQFVLGDDAVQAAWASAEAAQAPAGPLASPPPVSVPPNTGGLELVLEPGAARTLQFSVPSAGTLRLLCHLPGHVERGMVGSVILASR